MKSGFPGVGRPELNSSCLYVALIVWGSFAMPFIVMAVYNHFKGVEE